MCYSVGLSRSQDNRDLKRVWGRPRQWERIGEEGKINQRAFKRPETEHNHVGGVRRKFFKEKRGGRPILQQTNRKDQSIFQRFTNQNLVPKNPNIWWIKYRKIDYSRHVPTKRATNARFFHRLPINVIGYWVELQ